MWIPRRDLRNRLRTFDQRLELILFGNGFAVRHGGLVGTVQAIVVGDDRRDRTPSGLRPSDHAGVAATLRTPRDLHRHAGHVPK